jgi:transposase
VRNQRIPSWRWPRSNHACLTSPGFERNQLPLLPEAVDDYVRESDAIYRRIRRSAGPGAAGFLRVAAKATGVRSILFQTIHDVALMIDRERVGRQASPTGGVVDSQSVKAPEAKTRGYDAGKKIVGRKRHIAVDTDGRLLMVNLTPADISDSAGAQMILDGVRKRWPWLKHLFADGAYDRTQLMDKAAFRGFTIQIIKRSDAAMGFEVIPRRWVVERTFAWMTRWRRLVRDYEERIDCSEAMIHVALGSVLLRRIAHQ